MPSLTPSVSRVASCRVFSSPPYARTHEKGYQTRVTRDTRVTDQRFSLRNGVSRPCRVETSRHSRSRGEGGSNLYNRVVGTGVVGYAFAHATPSHAGCPWNHAGASGATPAILSPPEHSRPLETILGPRGVTP